MYTMPYYTYHTVSIQQSSQLDCEIPEIRSRKGTESGLVYNVYNMFRWRCYPCPVAVCNVYNVLLCNVYNVNITYSKYTIFLQVEVLPLPCRLKSLLSSLFTQSIKVLTMYFSTLFLQYFSRIFMDLFLRSFSQYFRILCLFDLKIKIANLPTQTKCICEKVDGKG